MQIRFALFLNLAFYRIVKIKPRAKIPRKTKAEYEWMGMVPPKKQGRLSQLNKHNVRTPSEFVLMARRIEHVT